VERNTRKVSGCGEHKLRKYRTQELSNMLNPLVREAVPLLPRVDHLHNGEKPMPERKPACRVVTAADALAKTANAAR
jgi:hypothetical protein